jgi:hypothetical protein
MNRMDKMGTESARFELWKQGIDSLFVYPFGGKEYPLQVDNYRSSFVHNTWLDIGYTAGVIPLIFIFLFILKHLRYILALFLKLKNYDDSLHFITIGLAIFIPTFFEPMMEASYVFISFLAFYFALLKNYYYFQIKNYRRDRYGVRL